jgi:hypothetical protein
MYHAELSGEIVKMVGWLEAPHPFLQGTVSPGDIALLEQLVIQTWKPPFMAHGWHDCSICGRKPGDGPITRELEGKRTLLGTAEIYVPDGDIMYSVPNLVLHYIEDHGYRPPEVFMLAMRKVDPQSPEYHAACDAVSKRATEAVAKGRSKR